MRRNAAIALAAVAGAVAGAVVARLRKQPGGVPPAPDERAEALRRKLAEARLTSAEEEDFEVAGMGAETVVEEAPRSAPAPPPPAAPPAEEPRAPGAEFEAMRQRIHEEGRAAAEEMRRAGETDA
ncbi:MAG TPA: hypothetical protein VHF23_07435 [Gaiellaceae bacterium]|nr:hypothetical protein [Gaiellaceae bacterium]